MRQPLVPAKVLHFKNCLPVFRPWITIIKNVEALALRSARINSQYLWWWRAVFHGFKSSGAPIIRFSLPWSYSITLFRYLIWSVFNVRRAPAFAFEQSKGATIGGAYPCWWILDRHFSRCWGFYPETGMQLCCYDGRRDKNRQCGPGRRPGDDTPSAIDLSRRFHPCHGKIEVGYASTSAATFFHFRRITLNPAVNRGVIIHPRSASISCSSR